MTSKKLVTKSLVLSYSQQDHNFAECLYMRCSDVTDVSVKTRRHAGGILSVNKD